MALESLGITEIIVIILIIFISWVIGFILGWISNIKPESPSQQFIAHNPNNVNRASPGNVFCPQCGKETDADGQFCQWCGGCIK